MEAKNINQLVTENLSYVKSLANRFKGKGVDFDDLVRGTQFIAYAAPFIRKAMEQAIKQQSASYGMPKDGHQQLNKKQSRPLSIDAPLGTNNKYTLLDILINKDALSEEEQVLRHRLPSHPHGRHRRGHGTETRKSKTDTRQGCAENGPTGKDQSPEDSPEKIKSK